MFLMRIIKDVKGFLLLLGAVHAAYARRDIRNAPAVSSLISLTSNSDLRIADNPTLVVNERQPITLVCQFSAAQGAKLREVVWYREFDNGASVKLLTHDAIMNITQVNELAKKNIEGRGATAIQIDKVSPEDDGWYQCHVGVYVNNKIVEKIGYIYLNVLVPPASVQISVHEAINGNNLFRHNFSLVCRVEQSKPAATLVFTRNGVEIAETAHVNSSAFINEMAESYADLLLSKDSTDNVAAVLTKGFLDISIGGNQSSSKTTIKYTILHLRAQISGAKLWESASFLLWTLHPRYDINAEYGCIARHESLNEAKSTRKILRPPRPEWLVIDVKPDEPTVGGNVILQLRSEPLENFFPRPVLLWTNDIKSVSNGRQFYVGNKLLLRNVRRNNTVYKVQAFNALGSASAHKTLILKKRDLSAPNHPAGFFINQSNGHDPMVPLGFTYLFSLFSAIAITIH